MTSVDKFSLFYIHFGQLVGTVILTIPGVDVICIHEGGVATLAGADADDFFYRIDEDDAIAFIACVGGLLNGLDRLFDVVVTENDVELEPRKEVHLIGTRAASQDDAASTAMAAYLGHIQADNTDPAQGFLDVVERIFTDDGFNLLGHRSSFSGIGLLAMLANVQADLFLHC